MTDDSQRRRRFPLSAIVLAACLASGFRPDIGAAQDANGLGALEAIENAFVRTIEQAEASVVSIARDKPRQFRLNDPDSARGLEDPNYIPNEYGTGIIIREDGLILTNYHVVRGPLDNKGGINDQMIYVRLADRRGLPARIHAADPRSDLAVLKIDAGKLRPIKLPDAGQIKPLRKGQLVIGLGNPFAIARDGSASAVWGIISNISRPALLEGDTSDPDVQKKQTIHHLGTLLQTDMRLHLGSSGGPLLNLKGELIGMTTSLAATEGYDAATGFAVPIDESTLRIIDTLMKGEEVEYGFLGITLPRDVAADDLKRISDRFNQHGAALIKDVLANSPASQGGLNYDDLILAVNDKPVYSPNDLMREISLLSPGTPARLRVFRKSNSGELMLTVIVGKWPVVDDEGIVATNRRYKPWRGLTADYSTARKRYFPPPTFRPQNIPAGVLITEVIPDTAAANAELQPGDLITHVNGVQIRQPQQFYSEVNRFKDEDVRLSLSTPGRQQVLIKPR